MFIHQRTAYIVRIIVCFCSMIEVFALAQDEVIPQENPVSQDFVATRFDGSNSLAVQNGLYIFRLSGTPKEIAQSEARLMGEKFYDGYVARGLTNALELLAEGLPASMQGAVPTVLDVFGFSRMRLGGDDDKGLIAGLAAATTLSFAELRRIYLQPDLLHIIPGIAVKLGAQKALEGSYDSFGCTSLAIGDQFTHNGERIIGRNQDYPGIGLYDTFPSVSFVTPSTGYRYVAVKPAGFVTAGINSMNEYGLVAALHTMYSSEHKFDGVPILTAVQRVIQYARDIDEALVLIDDMQKERGFVSGWGLHLSDRKNGKARAAVVEFDGAGFSVDWRLEGSSTLSNHYSTPERKKHSLYFSFGTTYHSIARLNRLDENVEKLSVGNVEKVVNVMRDRTDDYSGKTFSFSPWSISTIDQVSASVYLPDSKELYIAIDKAPVSDGRFMKLNMNDGFLGKYERTIIDPITFPWNDGNNDAISKPRFAAYPNFKAAYIAYENKDLFTAYSELKQAYAKEDNPYFRIDLGVIAMRLSLYSESVNWLNPLVASPILHPHHRRVARFFRALSLDALGKRSPASQDFSIVANDPQTWPALQEAAKVRRIVPLDSKKLTNQSFNLKYVDSFFYPAGLL